jgi:DNA-binding NtrC family response regulator
LSIDRTNGLSLGHPPAGISKDAKSRLIDYRWPASVRDLRNLLERVAILCDGGAAMERAMIEEALQQARFNKSRAAAALGLTRAPLYVRWRGGLE